MPWSEWIQAGPYAMSHDAHSWGSWLSHWDRVRGGGVDEAFFSETWTAVCAADFTPDTSEHPEDPLFYDSGSHTVEFRARDPAEGMVASAAGSFDDISAGAQVSGTYMMFSFEDARTWHDDFPAVLDDLIEGTDYAPVPGTEDDPVWVAYEEGENVLQADGLLRVWGLDGSGTNGSFYVRFITAADLDIPLPYEPVPPPAGVGDLITDITFPDAISWTLRGLGDGSLAEYPDLASHMNGWVLGLFLASYDQTAAPPSTNFESGLEVGYEAWVLVVLPRFRYWIPEAPTATPGWVVG